VTVGEGEAAPVNTASQAVGLVADAGAADVQQTQPLAPFRTRFAANLLLSVGQVAQVLGVCRSTVYKLCERGELAHVRLANAIRIRPSDLERLLAR
jgi:excisionase family DNA binding protein